MFPCLLFIRVLFLRGDDVSAQPIIKYKINPQMLLIQQGSNTSHPMAKVLSMERF